MKTIVIAAAALLAGVATSVSAQTYYDRGGERYYDRTYDDRYADAGDRECFNPRAGHFERVRPGERQDDLDFRRCRLVSTSGYVAEERPVHRERREYREIRREECWNPRARHYEEVRSGERQDDLDFGRCRIIRG